MAKYSFELKMKIIKEYLSGDGGYKYLADKYGIPNKWHVRQWVNAYQCWGEDGVLRKRKKTEYTVQMKLNAIELYLSSEMSQREVANHFDINNPSLVARWLKEYRESGIDGISKPKGRPSLMTNNSEKKVDSTPKNVADPVESSQIKELEKQVRLLQIENAYLKELRRLRKEEQLLVTKTSQESSATSEENSN